jgi:hypothetical protein
MSKMDKKTRAMSKMDKKTCAMSKMDKKTCAMSKMDKKTFDGQPAFHHSHCLALKKRIARKGSRHEQHGTE